MNADAGSELQAWMDLVAIEQLLYRYSDVVTRGACGRAATSDVAASWGCSLDRFGIRWMFNGHKPQS